jgi:hypothetical protein
MRELGERLGLGELIERYLCDPRGKNTQLPLPDLLRQVVGSRGLSTPQANDSSDSPVRRT